MNLCNRQLMDFQKRLCFRINVSTILLFSMNFFFSTYQSAIIPATSANQTDRISLLAFKHGIREDPLGALSSWNDSSHFCSWSGVTCSRRHNQRVISLDLESKRLVGSISPYVGNLTFLKYLNLKSNSFNGEIPQEISRLSRLQDINLSYNLVQGQIPINLTYCSELTSFNVRGNQLIGKIPTELGSLSKLITLGLGKNHLTGTIPVSLSNLSSLTNLSLSFNNLIGNIPLELGQLSRLKVFQIPSNNLSGTIPVQIYNISTISIFSVAANNFYGIIPSDIGLTLPNLQYISLAANRFSGPLPNSIYNASRLVKFDLFGNQFTGHILPNLGMLQNLSWLNLAVNQFGNGETDDLIFLNSLTNCSHLEVLQSSDNNLMGRLPLSIGNFSSKLCTFLIGENRIFGKIPAEIGNLVGLAELGLNNNQLTGNIPVSIGKLPRLIKVYLYENQLSGRIPSNICNNTELGVLSLHDNRLQGRIPPSLGNCKKLDTLSLTKNQLVGTIPKRVMGVSNMSFINLHLSQNLLTGNLPEEIGNLRSLVKLYLSDNKFSGEIPSSLGNCLGLNYLSLDGNIFEGIIPPSLKNLKGIKDLDLSRNKLSGPIPEYLGSIDSLQYLNLSSNDFEGEVPKQGLIFRNVSAFSVFGNPKLCGGIHQLNLQNCPHPVFEKQKKRKPLKRMFLMIGAVSCSILLGFFLIFFWRNKARKKPTSSASPLEKDTFQSVSYNELLKATDGFSSDNLVGVGSYGSVYKGRLGQERTNAVVAVKVLDLQRRGASKSFIGECEALRCIRHRNLVKVLTSCCSVDFKGNEFKALIFEFMPNGSLDNWLHPTSNEYFQRRRCLSFMERLNIAVDVAYALDYLHHRCHEPIVHCDLKPSNVLLDDGMNGHVGDFGLAKFLSGATNEVSRNYTSSVGLRGSVGYAAPEYGMGAEVSTNGDVYSYGILLLETFTGKRPTDAMFKDDLSLHNFAKTSLPDRVMQIIDPTLLHPQDAEDHEDGGEGFMISSNGEIKALESLIGLVRLGVKCSNESARERLEMAEVVKEVESIRNVFQGLHAAP